MRLWPTWFARPEEPFRPATSEVRLKPSFMRISASRKLRIPAGGRLVRRGSLSAFIAAGRLALPQISGSNSPSAPSRARRQRDRLTIESYVRLQPPAKRGDVALQC